MTRYRRSEKGKGVILRIYCVYTQISDAIRDGAEGFFRTQYGTISKMAVLLAFTILGIYLIRNSSPQQESSGLTRY